MATLYPVYTPWLWYTQCTHHGYDTPIVVHVHCIICTHNSNDITNVHTIAMILPVYPLWLWYTHPLYTQWLRHTQCTNNRLPSLHPPESGSELKSPQRMRGMLLQAGAVDPGRKLLCDSSMMFFSSDIRIMVWMSLTSQYSGSQWTWHVATNSGCRTWLSDGWPVTGHAGQRNLMETGHRFDKARARHPTHRKVDKDAFAFLCVCVCVCPFPVWYF